MWLTAKDAKHAKSRTGTNPLSVRDSVRVVRVVRGSAGMGGKAGLRARSHAYQSGSGSFTNHNCYHADGNG